jgi:hypothetical protein
MKKTEAQLATECLQAFQKQYPQVTSGDLQTWVIGWQTAVKNLSLNLPVSGSLPDLDGQDFYDLMQVYRCTPVTDQQSTIKAFEAVKEYLRANCH